MDADATLPPAGPCENCGRPGRRVADPYDREINDDDVYRLLCRRCLQARWDDI